MIKTKPTHKRTQEEARPRSQGPGTSCLVPLSAPHLRTHTTCSSTGRREGGDHIGLLGRAPRLLSAVAGLLVGLFAPLGLPHLLAIFKGGNGG